MSKKLLRYTSQHIFYGSLHSDVQFKKQRKTKKQEDKCNLVLKKKHLYFGGTGALFMLTRLTNDTSF